MAASVSQEPHDANISTIYYLLSLTALGCKVMQLMHSAGRWEQIEKMKHAFAPLHTQGCDLQQLDLYQIEVMLHEMCWG